MYLIVAAKLTLAALITWIGNLSGGRHARLHRASYPVRRMSGGTTVTRTIFLVIAVAAVLIPSTYDVDQATAGEQLRLGVGTGAVPGKLLGARKPQTVHRAIRPATGQLGSRPNVSKVIEGTPIGPNGDPILVLPPEEYEYPKCCGWACSCEPSE